MFREDTLLCDAERAMRKLHHDPSVLSISTRPILTGGGNGEGEEKCKLM